MILQSRNPGRKKIKFKQKAEVQRALAKMK
jgi:hypothetical protein